MHRRYEHRGDKSCGVLERGDQGEAAGCVRVPKLQHPAVLEVQAEASDESQATGAQGS